MDIDSCIDKYIELSSIAFQSKRSKANIFGKAKDTWKVRGAYDDEGLAIEFQKASKAAENDPDARLFHSEITCRVYDKPGSF